MERRKAEVYAVEGVPSLVLHETPNYTAERVREILLAAQLMADDLTEGGSEWAAVFAQACSLLSSVNRVQVQTASPLAGSGLAALGLKP